MGWKGTLAVAVSTALGAAPVYAQNCAKPQVPHIPDGSTATDAQMSDTLRAMEAYETAINAYLDCAYAEYSNAKKEGEAALARWNAAADAYRRAN